MPILSANDAEQVRSFLEDNLQDSVTIELFTESPSLLTIPGRRECEYCAETRELLEELTALSPKLTLDVHDLRTEAAEALPPDVPADMVPAIILRGQEKGHVRFFGIPAGYEFSTLLRDLASVSKGTSSLSQPTRDELSTLPSDVHIRVFVTPT